MKYPRATQGFTLVEVILTVAVLAILVTMTTPALLGFLRQRDIREEITTQLAIRDAMQVMLKTTGSLPADNTAWYTALAPYTNLSPGQIQLDTWGNARAYIRHTQSQTMLGSTVTVYYATLHSRGPNLIATTIINSTYGGALVALSGNAFDTNTASTNWWKNKADPVGAFGVLAVPSTSDDLMTRYTDYPEKVKQYNQTLERLTRVSEALENYSRSYYAERVVACNGASPPATCTTYPPEKQVHYPPAGDGSPPSYPDSTFYNDTVKTLVSTQTGGTAYIYNGVTDSARRTAMINLMRLLGLPDEYCCSAIETYTAGTVVYDKPFYYFSNPRARVTASTCGTRPALNNTKLPARVTNALVPDGTTGATCG